MCGFIWEPKVDIISLSQSLCTLLIQVGAELNLNLPVLARLSNYCPEDLAFATFGLGLQEAATSALL